MAKAYRALSNINHGVEKVDSATGESSVEMTVFPYGATVEGLSADVMKNLWDAGVLEEVDTVAPVVTKTVTSSAKPEAKSEGGSGGNRDTPPAAPVNTEGVASTSKGGKA